ncbi:protein SHQ1 homolog isoform X5 [Rousettus aegyptiacus]|uniref:Protein SHQ1 homolog n=1 Tax=Rousettus aegyptiacus TaxID=9407 RepID=A0A7J8HV25_ROUAE|nr:protein SHQ1 homolog isoform X5 [Rousettus aegyptiacus]KAF6476167.1 SHQ1, H/ACA ribonucleoprotein assembly factor [Rousettus aegyptiacus]
MLTPAFDLSQDPDFLTIAIRVPYARVSEFDVYFKGVDFKFYAKPYFLRLTLPGRIVENGSEQGSYDADKGIFTIQLPKETPGQHFEGLNMLTALLAPRKSRTAKPLVEEIGTSEVSEEGVEDDDEFDWEIEQFPYNEVSESALNPQYHYGFGDLRSGVFQRLQDEFSDVVDIKDPDFTSAAERRQKRLAAELAKFDPDHYLADLFEDEAVEQVLKYNPWWTEMYSKMMASLGKSQEQENHAALGKSAVLKCLLDIHKIFQESDPAYILNDLYISDYCVWIQKAKSKKLAALAEALKEVSLTKAQLGLELEELEAAALLVQEEETALIAAHSSSRQQTPSTSSEASDLEESDSPTSSETEDSDSEQEELKDSESKIVNSLRGPFLEESSALLVDDGGVCRKSAILRSGVSQGKPLVSSLALGGSGPLIEELGEQLKTVVQISEPEGSVAGNHGSVQDRDSWHSPND